MGEKILAVRSEVITNLKYPEGAFLLDNNTINNTFKYLNEFIEVVDRDAVEGNPDYRQLIPYVVLEYNGTYFSAVRTKEGGDPRLHGKCIIGFGGHMNLIDLPSNQMDLIQQIKMNAQRELNEELIIKSDVVFQPSGFINDFSTPVSKDHFGIYINAKLESPLVYINEQSILVNPCFMTKTELESIDSLESWSKLVISVL
jgi:predicted NUDIX family phosphoesterase